MNDFVSLLFSFFVFPTARCRNVESSYDLMLNIHTHDTRFYRNRLFVVVEAIKIRLPRSRN